MQEVFVAITEILGKSASNKEANKLTLRNSAGRTVFVILSHDPDVCNAHNRAGEAENSHLKAKQKGFKDFWTIISKTGLAMYNLRQESQTTTEWFDVTEILARDGRDWEDFRQRLAGAVGIPLPTTKAKLKT